MTISSLRAAILARRMAIPSQGVAILGSDKGGCLQSCIGAIYVGTRVFSSPWSSRDNMPTSATPERADLAPALDPPPWILIMMFSTSFIYSSASISANGWTEVDPARVIEAGAWFSSRLAGARRLCIAARIAKSIMAPKAKGMNLFSPIPPVHVNSMQ
jgi:hypothetical protein